MSKNFPDYTFEPNKSDSELHWETNYEPLLSQMYTEDEIEKLKWIVNELKQPDRPNAFTELKDRILELTKEG